MSKKEPSITRRQALYRSLAGVFLYISVASQRAEACFVDQSAVNPILCDGLDPQFETPSSTADGFTVQVSNYDANFTWSVNTTAGSATISGTGLITVTGLTTGAGATVTVSTSKLDHTTQQADVSGSALTGSALTPTFATPTTTADGFTIQVSNYDANFTWSVNTTAGSVTISGEGLVTVTGLAPGESATVTAVTTRTGYNSSTASASASSVAVPPTPVPMLPIWGVAALSGMLTVLAKQLKKK
jgi:phosphotransferase system HPr-like phosphotransfer protein